MQFFVILPNGSKIDIELDSDKKVVDIISIMDKSDRIQSLGLIDHFHLWFQPDIGGKVNLMKDLNKTIGDYGITLESNINMQVEHTTLLEIAMNISKSRAIDRLTPDFESEAEKIQKRFRGNRERKKLREQYPDASFNKKTKGWIIFKSPVDMASRNSIARRKKVKNPPKNKRMLDIPLKQLGNDVNLIKQDKSVIKQGGLAWCPHNKWCGNYSTDISFTPDDFIKDVIYKPTEKELRGEWRCEILIPPGASIKLIKQKIKEGFKIKFEDKRDFVKIWPWLDPEDWDEDDYCSTDDYSNEDSDDYVSFSKLMRGKKNKDKPKKKKQTQKKEKKKKKKKN